MWVLAPFIITVVTAIIITRRWQKQWDAMGCQEDVVLEQDLQTSRLRAALTAAERAWYDSHIKLSTATELPEMEKVRAQLREEEVSDLQQDVPAHGASKQALQGDDFGPGVRWHSPSFRCAACVDRG